MRLNPSPKRTRARVVTILLVSVLFAVVSQLLLTRAAATFVVNSLGDTPDAAPGNGTCADAGGLCTLRAAIQEGNALSGDDTITFSVAGTINLTSELPILATNFSINGPGSSSLTVRRDSGGNYRIFQTSGVTSIVGMTITNGRTPDSVGGATAPSGGGIWQTGGSLTLRDVTITGNATGNGGTNATSGSSFGGWGGFGGGIYASGTLTMTDCVISNNTTGNGGTGGGYGGSGGRGAGIYFAPGTLTLSNVSITGNRTGNSGGPTSGNSGYGAGMWIGGDFFPSQNSTVTMSHVSITNNRNGDNITTGSAAGGAGIYVYQGTVTLTNSVISDNHTGNANPSSFSGTAGSGGGIFNNGILTVKNSLINGNTTGDSVPGSNSAGGGISNNFSLTLINTTVSGNSTGAGPSMGGGVYSFGTTTLINCTITKNISPNDYGNGVTGTGTFILRNTIIAGNGNSANDPDLQNPLFSPSTFTSQGHNVIGNADGFASSFNASGDQIGTGGAPLNPQLGPLTNNGGPSATHALLTNSPALDAGSNALAKDPSDNPLLTDQRGAQRIADGPDPGTVAVVDVGAFEFLQSLEDITDKTTNEDTPITVTFGLGDSGPGATSVTASSSNQSLVPGANLLMIGTGAARTLQITPVANQSGVTTITVTVNLSGGGTLVDAFQLNVSPVNDPPTFTKGPDQTVNEDSGPQTVTNWATTISAGPDEGAQVVSFNVTNNTNASLFSAGPAVSASGTLTYTPAANAFGSAVITIVLKDDGGTVNGGRDTSVAQTFTINVRGINDVPTFAKGADQTIAEDAGYQFVNTWATGISAGPNESNQSVSFIVTNNTNSSLFQSQPFISSSGQLNYVPAFNANGTAVITIVAKDSGGTADGGVDTSAPQTFTINVTAVNDAPVNSVPFSSQTNQHTPLVFSATTFNAVSISDVDAGNDPIRVSLTLTNATLSLGSTTGLTFVTGDGVDDLSMTFTGTITAINSCLNGLTFKPNNGFSGTTTIQIISDDQGHNGAGGAKSTTTNFQVQVRSGGRFLFNIPSYGVNESGSTTTITVLRSGGNAGTATVNFSTSNGTATGGTTCTSGVDYVPTSGTFTWNNGDSSVRQFTVVICNDAANEEDETINLTLSNAGGTGSLGTLPTATVTIGNDDAPLLLIENGTADAIALDLVTQTRGPFSLINPLNLSTDQRTRVSLFVWHLGLLPNDIPANVVVTATDSDGGVYNLPVESMNPVVLVDGLTQIDVRLPDNVIGAPRALRVKVTLRGPGSNEALLYIAGP